jgi:hypothetical protein
MMIARALVRMRITHTHTRARTHARTIIPRGCVSGQTTVSNPTSPRPPLTPPDPHPHPHSVAASTPTAHLTDPAGHRVRRLCSAAFGRVSLDLNHAPRLLWFRWC